MTIFTLGTGRYCVAQSHHANLTPCLTIRRLPKKEETGTVLEGLKLDGEDFDLIIDVETPEAATVLLAVAQAIAFAHGIKTP